MLYVGTDIIEIARIKNAAQKNPAFMDRILTAREKEHRPDRGDFAPFLAGRFAAKEAVLKCLGVGLSRLSWHDVEIIPDELGAPQVLFKEAALAILSKKGLKSVKVSISHSRDYAVAVAVGEGNHEDNNR